MKKRRFDPITATLLLLAVGLSTCAGLRLYKSASETVATFPSAETARLIYLFQLPDCVEYRGMENVVKSVATKTGVTAIGVPLDDSETLDMVNINLTLQLGFEVEAQNRRAYEDAMLAMGLTVTPAIVLVDRRGVVRLSAPPTKEQRVLRALEASLVDYLSVLLPSS